MFVGPRSIGSGAASAAGSKRGDDPKPGKYLTDIDLRAGVDARSGSTPAKGIIRAFVKGASCPSPVTTTEAAFQLQLVIDAGEGTVPWGSRPIHTVRPIAQLASFPLAVRGRPAANSPAGAASALVRRLVTSRNPCFPAAQVNGRVHMGDVVETGKMIRTVNQGMVEAHAL